MIKAVIVEDEFNAMNSLEKLIKYTQKEISVVAKIDNVSEAIEQLPVIKPSLVFLDIELLGGSAFDILDAIDTTDFKIVFTTAYDEFAIKAIKFDTVDYLLKPIDADELSECLKRFREVYNKEKKYKEAVEKISEIDRKQQQSTLLLKTTDQQFLLKIDDIIRCQSDGSYTIFYTDEHKIMCSRNLKYYEGLLSAHAFIRVHQSHLINSRYIESVSNSSSLRLKDGTEIPIATRKRALLKQFLAEQ
ncbi:LytR/AlgR family response regulator transcription factor [Zhouia amylolytica]|uniref:Two component transcriptional regulator, lyttr family protein n=1 Tax=Zhouia amylolytica AD3 TaxID=1286632 RepID=W2UR07_9FLAO|nr:LytTR family DNA-binding domain-containing protein [Zhouia amylolytica]ETN95911.1 two component transcriptional regulator, lyttr family protein [Zhouia amylolytica AD3]